MANAKFVDLVDPRLIEAAFHRFESAKALHQASAEHRAARERYERAFQNHEAAKEAYAQLEADVARGVRLGARVSA